MNPLIVLAVTMAVIVVIVKLATWLIDDEDLTAICSLLCTVIFTFCCLLFIAVALFLNGAAVSAKLWNQQHGTNYSATEWFYAVDRITGDKQ